MFPCSTELHPMCPSFTSSGPHAIHPSFSSPSPLPFPPPIHALLALSSLFFLFLSLKSHFIASLWFSCPPITDENNKCGNQSDACQTILLSLKQDYLSCFHNNQGIKKSHYVIYKSHNRRNDGTESSPLIDLHFCS